jgi:NO-binding membrane sensor protein with MHYT domain
VIVSIAIAISASYAALDLAGRVADSRGMARRLWLSGGATAMGLGIWSMHYVGMLAFSLPVAVEYDWPMVLASLLAAILASAVALHVAARGGQPAAYLKHRHKCQYRRMHAWRMPAAQGDSHYDSPIVAVSCIAMPSLVALYLVFTAPTDAHWRHERLLMGQIPVAPQRGRRRGSPPRTHCRIAVMPSAFPRLAQWGSLR